MLFVPTIAANESHLKLYYSDAHLLPYWRTGVGIQSPPGEPIFPIGSLPLGYAVPKSSSIRRPVRIFYLSCLGVPFNHKDGVDREDKSFNLVTPASVVAGNPTTEKPTKFGRLSAVGDTIDRFVAIQKRNFPVWQAYARDHGFTLPSHHELMTVDQCWF
jgi:hypothetical protein